MIYQRPSATMTLVKTTKSGSGCLPCASVSFCVNLNLMILIATPVLMTMPVGESPGSRTATGTAPSTIDEGLNRGCPEEDRILTIAVLPYLPERMNSTLALGQLGQAVLIPRTILEAGALQDAIDLMSAGQETDQASAVTNITPAESGGAPGVARLWQYHRWLEVPGQLLECDRPKEQQRPFQLTLPDTHTQILYKRDGCYMWQEFHLSRALNFFL